MKFRQSILPFTFAFTLAVALPACAQDERIAGPPDPVETRPAVAQTAPSGIMTVVAGSGYDGYGGIGGPATSADLILPQGVVVDSVGDIYISDPVEAVIYKVTASTGKIALYAGTGKGGYSGDGGAATAAKLGNPYGLALDSAGNLYIADQRNNRIRKVTAATGKISTVAGNGAGAGPGANDDCPIPEDGIAATKSTICLPLTVAVDSSDNIYIADYGDNEIRKVAASTGIITTVAGSVYRVGYDGDGALAVNASLNYPNGMALDSARNVYIADTGNCAIRKVTASTGVISTVLGSPASACTSYASPDGTPVASATIGKPHAVAVDSSGNIFATDAQYQLVYLLSESLGKIYTIGGVNLPTPNPYNSLFPEVTLNAGPGAYQFIDQASGITVDENKNSPTYGDVLFSASMDGLVYKIAQPAVTQANIPLISPAFSTTVGSSKITITAPQGGSIYYTTNGKVPTTSSTKYAGAFTLSKSAVITAFAGKSGALSPAAIDVFMSNAPPTLAPTYLTSPSPVQVTISDTGTGGAIYYTTDGTDPTAGGATVKKYTTQITAKDGEQVKAAYLPAPVTDFAGNVWQQWSAVTTVDYAIQLP